MAPSSPTVLFVRFIRQSINKQLPKLSFRSYKRRIRNRLQLFCINHLNGIYFLIKFISASNLFVYCFPVLVGIPPHRYSKFSIPEISLDVLVFVGWLVAPSLILGYGHCTHDKMAIMESGVYKIINLSTTLCVEWTVAVILAFLAAFFYFCTASNGVMNMETEDSSAIMFARGNWKRY